MREIKKIVLHCTATLPSMDIGVEEIDRWHKRRGWRGCGYHIVIRLDGTAEYGRPLEQVGAHVRGHNYDSIGIAYVGGYDENKKAKDTMNEEQEATFLDLVDELRQAFGYDIEVKGHNDYSYKACPCFKVHEKWPGL